MKSITRDLFLPINSAVDSLAARTPLDAFLCPSDLSFPSATIRGSSNYGVCAGSNVGWTVSAGLSGQLDAVRETDPAKADELLADYEKLVSIPVTNKSAIKSQAKQMASKL